jgi:hypothetical protein
MSVSFATDAATIGVKYPLTSASLDMW